MAGIQRPASMDAYKELLKQAVFEAEELRMSVEYDMEFMEDALAFIAPLEKSLKDLQQQLESGDYQFGGENLSFMSIVEQQADVILPFKTLLRLINDTHIKGLAE